MNAFIGKTKSLVVILRRKPWIIFFFFGFCIITWFHGRNIIDGGDFSWPISFANFFQYTTSSWDNSINTGYFAVRQLASFYPFAVWGVLLESFQFSPFIIQLAIFYISFVSSGLGMYALSRVMGLRNRGAMVSGFLYMFSPYALLVAWVPAYGTYFPFYSFLPAALFFLVKSIKEENDFHRIALFSLLTFLSFFGATFSNPVFLILFLLLSFLFFLYFFFTINFRKIVIVKSYLLFLFFYLLLNAFWLLPLATNLQASFNNADNLKSGLISDRATMKLDSVPPQEAFRMSGLWVLSAEVDGDHYYDWYTDTHSPWNILLSFSFIIFAILSLIRKNEQRPLAIFLCTFLLFGVFINSALKIGGDLGRAHQFIFDHSDFLARAFRSVYPKCGVLLVLPIAMLAGNAFDLFSIFNRKLYASLLFFSFLMVFFSTIGRPFIDGRIIKSKGSVIPSSRTHLPDAYMDFQKVDTSLKIDSRYLSLPIPLTYNIGLKWDDGGYGGSDFMRFLLQRPVINTNDHSLMLGWLVEALSQYDWNKVLRLLGFLNTRFIVFHKDIILNTQKNYLTATHFSFPNNFIQSFSSKYIAVYTLPTDKFLPHIYIPHSTTLENKDEIFKYDSTMPVSSAFYSLEQNYDKQQILATIPIQLKEKPTLEFRKISATKYRIVVHNSGATLPLVFSESFNSGWKLYPETLMVDQPFVLRSRAIFYKVSEENNQVQANPVELANFIDNGEISSLGYRAPVAFVTKNFQGSIQNDNISKGNFFATWFTYPLVDEFHHLEANGYANSWLIPVQEVCSRYAHACRRNQDGTYDISFSIFFSPQNIFYTGLAVSITALIVVLILFARTMIIPAEVARWFQEHIHTWL